MTTEKWEINHWNKDGGEGLTMKWKSNSAIRIQSVVWRKHSKICISVLERYLNTLNSFVYIGIFLGFDGWSLSQNNVFMCGGRRPVGHTDTQQEEFISTARQKNKRMRKHLHPTWKGNHHILSKGLNPKITGGLPSTIKLTAMAHYREHAGMLSSLPSCLLRETLRSEAGTRKHLRLRQEWTLTESNKKLKSLQ